MDERSQKDNVEFIGDLNPVKVKKKSVERPIPVSDKVVVDLRSHRGEREIRDDNG